MFYLVTIGLIIFLTVSLFFVGQAMQGQEETVDYSGNKSTATKETDTAGTFIKWGSLATGILLFALITPLKVFHSVPAGHVGVVYQFGNIVDQTGAGLVTTLPWQQLREANVQIQRSSFEKLDAFSQETQDVFITATLNYQVSPEAIQKLYSNVGPNYFEKLVPNRMNQIFKDETVKYTAVQIAPHREQIRKSVKDRLEKELSPYSIEITDLLIDNISFSPEFTKAIEDKQIATQQAQAEFNRVKAAKNKAQQAIAAAKGEARAYRLKKQTLTPLLVRQNLIDKLGPDIKVIVIPDGGNFLLGSDILGTTKR